MGFQSTHPVVDEIEKSSDIVSQTSEPVKQCRKTLRDALDKVLCIIGIEHYTNRDALLDELDALDNHELAVMLEDGTLSAAVNQIVCHDCIAAHGGNCPREDGDVFPAVQRLLCGVFSEEDANSDQACGEYSTENWLDMDFQGLPIIPNNSEEEAEE